MAYHKALRGIKTNTKRCKEFGKIHLVLEILELFHYKKDHRKTNWGNCHPY